MSCSDSDDGHAGAPSASLTPVRRCKFYKKRTQSCKFGSLCTICHASRASGAELGGATERTDPSTHTKRYHDFMGGFDEDDRLQDRDENVKLCPQWINTGSCPRQRGCQLRHGTLGLAIGKAKAAWVAERRMRRDVLPSTPDDDIPYQDKVGRLWLSSSLLLHHTPCDGG
jgi:hypothetical protein